MTIARRILAIINEMLLHEAADVEVYMAQIRKALPNENLSSIQTVVEDAIGVLGKNYRVQWFMKSVLIPSIRKGGSVEDVGKYLGLLKPYMTSDVLLKVFRIDRYSFDNDPSITDVLEDFQQYLTEYKLEKEMGDEFYRLITEEESEGDGSEIMRFDNGWAWFNLGWYQSDIEQRSMSHCGKCDDEDSTLLSLRKPIKVGRQTWWRSMLTVELRDNGSVGMIQGKRSNPNVFDFYMLKLFLNSDVIKHLGDEGREVLKYWGDEEKSILKKERPELFINIDMDEILDKHRKWLNKEDGGKRAVLSGFYLENIELAGANFKDAKLNEINFVNVSLKDTNFRGANLVRANFTSCNLDGSDFREAVFSDRAGGATFRDTSLKGVNMEGADTSEVYFYNSHLTERVSSY